MPKNNTLQSATGARQNEALATFLENLVPKSIVIVGAGKSGLAVQKLLDSLGLQPLLVDDAPQPSVQRSSLSSELSKESFGNFRAAVLSPGVSLAHPVCLELLRKDVPIFSEVEVGLCFLRKSVRLIGVTGTNGKSTVTHSMAKLFEAHGAKAQAIGNIGLAVSEYALQSLAQSKSGEKTEDTLVVELSSYQLETMYFRGFDAAVFTNFSSDHLARYKTLENYFRAKWRLTRILKPGAALALSEDVVHQAMLFGASLDENVKLTIVLNADKVKISLAEEQSAFDLSTVHPRYEASGVAPNPYPRNYNEIHFEAHSPSNFRFRTMRQNLGLGLTAKHTTDAMNELLLDDSILRGRHNAQNISFCLFAESTFFPERKSISETFFNATKSDFSGLEHRLEKVETAGSNRNIFVINDSKSTSFICTAQALACFQQGIHLILGGQLKDKNLIAAFDPETNNIDHKLIQKIYCIGPDATWLATEASKITGAPSQAYATMQQAVRAALEKIAEHEVLLFSPGAASFDSFKNFEDRGIQFKLEVARLLDTKESNSKRS